MATATKPTESDTLEPYIIRLRMSLPNSSVPKKFFVLFAQKPGCKPLYRSCSSGLYGEIKGANIAHKIKIKIMTKPMIADLFF